MFLIIFIVSFYWLFSFGFVSQALEEVKEEVEEEEPRLKLNFWIYIAFFFLSPTIFPIIMGSVIFRRI